MSQGSAVINGYYYLVDGPSGPGSPSLTVSGFAFIGHADGNNEYQGAGIFVEGEPLYSPSAPGAPTVGIGGDLYLGGGPDTAAYYNGPGWANGGWGVYNLWTGTLNVGGHAFVGYNNTGMFNQGAFYDPNDPASFSPAGAGAGGTVQIGGNLYIGGGFNDLDPDSGTGVYNLLYGGNAANPGLLVAGDINVGYSGTGYFNQGAFYDPNSPGTLKVAGDGGAVQVGGSLYIGDTNGTGTYNLITGTLNVTNNLVVGNGGTGYFNQGAFYDPNSPGTLKVAGDGGAVQVGGSLYIGNASGTGTYNLYNGSLAVTGKAYVGCGGAGAFNQFGGSLTAAKVIIGTNGAYALSGGTLGTSDTPTKLVNKGQFNYSTGQLYGDPINMGTTTVSGGTALNPLAFHGVVINGTSSTAGAFTATNSYVTFAGTVINSALGTFHLTDTSATFLGAVINNGTWITDPSSLTFDSSFTINPGGSVTANGDTYTILGTFTDSGTLIVEGKVQINLEGSGSSVGTLVIEPDGSLIIAGNSLDIAGSTYGPGDYVENGQGWLSPLNPVPIPGAIWLLVSGLAGFAAMRRRFKR